MDWFEPNSIPEEVCDRHGSYHVCAESGKLPGPYCPEESISTKSVYFLEADSPYWQLSRDEIRKWIPRAYFDFNSLWEINSLDYNNPEHVKYFCDIHTQPPLPDPGEIWDDSLDKLKEFFEGLIPGNNNENNQNQGTLTKALKVKMTTTKTITTMTSKMNMSRMKRILTRNTRMPLG